MSFHEELLSKAQPYFDAQTKKPFLLGILNGDLPSDKYLYWVRVDYPYLINFSRILAMGVTKAEDVESMRIMQGYLNWIMDEELAFHEGYAAKQGISKIELANHKMGPIKYAYTRHELSNAYSGSLVDLIAGLLPCIVGYQIVSRSLVKGKTISPDNPYYDWLKIYSSDVELDIHTQKILKLFDQLASQCSKPHLAKLEQTFLTSERYETMCWDAYYNKEEWPVYE